MKNVIVWSTVICQDMFECPGGKMDECICLVIGNGLVDINDAQNKPDQCDASKDHVYIGWIFFANKKMIECGAYRLG